MEVNKAVGNVDDLDILPLKCGCRVKRRDLPVNGGDRLYTCDHDREWIIRGRVERTIHLTAREKD